MKVLSKKRVNRITKISLNFFVLFSFLLYSFSPFASVMIAYADEEIISDATTTESASTEESNTTPELPADGSSEPAQTQSSSESVHQEETAAVSSEVSGES